MADRLLPIAGTILGTAVGGPVGGVAGGALGGLGGGAIRGNPLQGLASGAIGGAGSAIGSQFLGPLIGNQLAKVLPDVAGRITPLAADQLTTGFDVLGESGDLPIGLLGASQQIPPFTPLEGTGLFGVSSGALGEKLGGLIGGGVAGTAANQLIQGGGPQPPRPPSLGPVGPLPGAPPNLQNLVVKTGGGLPQTLAELLRRR